MAWNSWLVRVDYIRIWAACSSNGSPPARRYGCWCRGEFRFTSATQVKRIFSLTFKQFINICLYFHQNGISLDKSWAKNLPLTPLTRHLGVMNGAVP
jgi:hypothetical protein